MLCLLLAVVLLMIRDLMMQFEIEGTILMIYEPVKFESGFLKREFVVKSNDQYPQDIKFELTKDKCGLLDSYQIGAMVRISFNIRSSLWQNKYFTNLQVERFFFTSSISTLFD